MAPLRWGIASCGKISNDFACGLSSLPASDHELVAVAARNEESAKTFAETFGAKKFYAGYESLAKDPNVDIVYIGSVNPTHLEIGILMLDHGKHVLCEKPLCMNEKQAKKLLDHAKAKKLFCMEAIWSRFFPAYIHLKKRIDDGDLGEIKEVEVQFGFEIENVERVAKKSLGGGTILDIGIYTIQASLWGFRQAPTLISASGSLNSEGVDVEVNGELKFKNGGVAKIHLSAKKELSNTAVFKGTKGTITIPYFWCPTSLIDIDGKELKYELPKNTRGKLVYTNSTGLSYQAEEARKCINQGLLESPSVSHNESLLIAHIEDELRRQIGVKYAADD